jgi:hypothetical protein
MPQSCGEETAGFVTADRLAPFPCHVACARVDLHRRAADADAELDAPLRRPRPHTAAVFLFRYQGKKYTIPRKNEWVYDNVYADGQPPARDRRWGPRPPDLGNTSGGQPGGGRPVREYLARFDDVHRARLLLLADLHLFVPGKWTTV